MAVLPPPGPGCTSCAARDAVIAEQARVLEEQAAVIAEQARVLEEQAAALGGLGGGGRAWWRSRRGSGFWGAGWAAIAEIPRCPRLRMPCPAASHRPRSRCAAR